MTLLQPLHVSPAESHRTESPRLEFVHVPTPGDHYSPATGSAVMTVIHGLTAAHASLGRRATILLSHGATQGYPPYPAGETREIDLPPALPSRPRKLFDAMSGRTLFTRPFAAGQFAAVAGTLGPTFNGSLFIHNAPAPIPLLRKKLPQAFLALYAHNQLFNTYSRREIRHVLDCAHAILCVSNFVAKDVAARAGGPSAKIKTVLNGVDIETFSPAFSTFVGSAPHKDVEPPVILFLGRIQEAKGPDLLLRAAGTLLAEAPARPFKVRIVGSQNFDSAAPLTPYERELRRLAEPLRDRVEFVPFIPRDQVPAEYRRAAIFVAPSNWDEPFGLTIAEALACGVPCIVSDRGGIPEVAADAALYFSPPDTTTLARHLATLLNDPAERTAWGHKARTRAQFLAWPNRYQDLLRALDLQPA